MSRGGMHVGRQAIRTRDGELHGFELLFRPVAPSTPEEDGAETATVQVIHEAFTEFGLASLVGEGRCFVNLTDEFLTGRQPLPFGPDQVVLEILETVSVDEEVIDHVLSLAEDGYVIALDGLHAGSGQDWLLSAATYVRLGLGTAEPDDLRALVEHLHDRGLLLIAEELMTPEELATAIDLGFDLFQGPAVGRPQAVSATSLERSAMHRMELLSALTAVEVDINRAVDLISGDPEVSLRVLQGVNSAHAGLLREITSIRQAVVLLGLNQIQHWVALMVLADVAGDAEDFIAATVARARLCQTVAASQELPGETGFIVGLLAGIADLLGTSAAELLGVLPLAAEVTDAVLHHRGPLGQVLTTVLAYERRSRFAGTDARRAADLSHAHLAAIAWSTRLLEESAS